MLHSRVYLYQSLLTAQTNSALHDTCIERADARLPGDLKSNPEQQLPGESNEKTPYSSSSCQFWNDWDCWFALRSDNDFHRELSGTGERHAGRTTSLDHSARYGYTAARTGVPHRLRASI